MTVGEMEPGTKAVGVIGLRIFAGLAAAYLMVEVRPVNEAIQSAMAGLHNWAGPLSDRLGKTHTAGRPIHVGSSAYHGIIAERLATMAEACGVLVVVYLLLAARKLRGDRLPPPGTTTVPGWRRPALIAAAVLAVLLVAVVAALQFEMGREALALGLRGTAWVGLRLWRFFSRVES